MSELVRLRQPNVEVKSDEVYHFAGVYCFGGGVFLGQRKTGMEFRYTKLTRLKPGNFVYPKLMAWEGALAIVPPHCDGLVVSTEFPVFEVDVNKVLPEVLDAYFRTPCVWPELAGASTGTNVRRRRLNPRDFLRYEFPLPPMAAQLKLREVARWTAGTNRHRQQAAKKLAALLPAILDRAFRGEL
jgi:type I restriction enzyme S subunit